MAEPGGATPLHFAVLHPRCDVELVSWLVENGADVNQSTQSDVTPLLCACYVQFEGAARLLLECCATAGVAENSTTGVTPLHALGILGGSEDENVYEYWRPEGMCTGLPGAHTPISYCRSPHRLTNSRHLHSFLPYRLRYRVTPFLPGHAQPLPRCHGHAKS